MKNLQEMPKTAKGAKADKVNATNVNEALNASNTTDKVEKIEVFNHIKDVKTDLKSIVEKYKALKGELDKDDVKKRKELEKAEDKEILAFLSASYQGLFNIVDFVKKTEGGKVSSAFAVLSKLPIQHLVNAGLNGRRYSFKAVRKAFKALLIDKDNSALNEATGQRLSTLINEVHNSKDSLKVYTFLQTLINEKFINLDKCPEFVSVLCCQYETTTNERVKDMYQAYQFKQAEATKKKEIERTLWECYKNGEIELTEKIENETVDTEILGTV